MKKMQGVNFHIEEFPALIEKLRIFKLNYIFQIDEAGVACNNEKIARVVCKFLDLDDTKKIWEVLNDRHLLKALLQYLDVDGVLARSTPLPLTSTGKINLNNETVIYTGKWDQEDFLILQIFTYIKHYVELFLLGDILLESINKELRNISDKKGYSHFEVLLLWEIYILIHAYRIRVAYSTILKISDAKERKNRLDKLFTDYLKYIGPLLINHEEFCIPCGSSTHAVYLMLYIVDNVFKIRVDDSSRSEINLFVTPLEKQDQRGGLVDYLINVALVSSNNGFSAMATILNEQDDYTGKTPFEWITLESQLPPQGKQTVENCVYLGYYRNRSYRIERALEAKTVLDKLDEMDKAFVTKKYNQPTVDDKLLLLIRERYQSKNNLGESAAHAANPSKLFSCGNAFELPQPVDKFIGRVEELKDLGTHFGSADSIALKIVGTGGIGKSQLACCFVHERLESGQFKWAVWLNGGWNQSSAERSLNTDFAILAKELGLDVTGFKKKKLYSEIYRRLSENGRGIIVFDDIPDFSLMTLCFPKFLGFSNIDALITSKNDLQFGSGVIEYKLYGLKLGLGKSLGEAENYVISLLPDASIDEARNLANTLKGYPLTISQAAVYIKHNGKIDEFCKRYQSELKVKEEYLAESVDAGNPYEIERQERSRPYGATTLAVVQMSMEQIRTSGMTDEQYLKVETILMAAAYIAPEIPVLKILLGQWLQGDENEIDINRALKYLRMWSLLEAIIDNEHFLIHQVVQDVSRLRESQEQTVKRLLQWCEIIDGYLNNTGSIESSVDEKKCIALEAHTAILADQLDRFRDPTDEIILAKRVMLGATGLACKLQGKEKEAKACFEQALKCHHTLSPAEATKQKYKEGLCLMTLGMLTPPCNEGTSIRYEKEALSILQEAKDAKRVDIGRCQMNLGLAKLTSGDPLGARVDLENALQILREAVGKDHIDVAGCEMNLGVALLACGEPKTAVEKFNLALPIFTATSGEQHTDVGRCKMNLGMAAMSMGDLSLAKVMILEALPILESSLSKRHAEVGNCLMNLGVLGLNTQDLGVAKKYLEEASDILKYALSEEHIDVVNCDINLGLANLQLKDITVAKQYLSSAIKILKKKFGENSEAVGKCYLSLGRFAYLCGDFHQSHEYLKKALTILQKTLGDMNAEVGGCYMDLGVTALIMGRPERANSHFEKAFPRLKESLGEKNVIVGRCLAGWGRVAMALENSGLAKKYFTDALSILKGTLGNAHPDVGVCMMNLGAALLDKGQLAESMVYLNEALPILESSLGENHPDVGGCLQNLGLAALKINKPEFAKKYLKRSMLILKKHHLPDSDTLKNCQDLYAEAQQKLEQQLSDVTIERWHFGSPELALREVTVKPTSSSKPASMERYDLDRGSGEGPPKF